MKIKGLRVFQCDRYVRELLRKKEMVGGPFETQSKRLRGGARWLPSSLMLPMNRGGYRLMLRYRETVSLAVGPHISVQGGGAKLPHIVSAISIRQSVALA